MKNSIYQILNEALSEVRDELDKEKTSPFQELSESSEAVIDEVKKEKITKTEDELTEKEISDYLTKQIGNDYEGEDLDIDKQEDIKEDSNIDIDKQEDIKEDSDLNIEDSEVQVIPENLVPYVRSAISAGLGALTLRKTLKTTNS